MNKINNKIDDFQVSATIFADLPHSISLEAREFVGKITSKTRSAKVNLLPEADCYNE